MHEDLHQAAGSGDRISGRRYRDRSLSSGPEHTATDSGRLDKRNHPRGDFSPVDRPSRHRHHDHRRARSALSSSGSRSPESRPVRERQRSPSRRKDVRKQHHDGSQPSSRPRSRSPARSLSRQDRHSKRRRVETHRSSRHPRSRSRSPKHQRRSNDGLVSPVKAVRKPLPSQDESYRGNPDDPTDAIGPPVEKEKPNFKPTGLLAAETNKIVVGTGDTAQDIVLKYHEPPEARKPPSSEAWVLYVFKGTSPDPIHTYQLHSRSCWLMGRELAVADIPVEHPSCSKQHAVFQFRYIVKKDEWGEKKGKVRLYVLDLESSNGTFLNGEKLEAARYMECLTGDVVKFGESEREYVLLLPPK